MSEHSALYSIIQFSPVVGRREGVNIGVVIVCPELQAVVSRFSSDNARVHERLGSRRFDDARLTAAKRALERGLAKAPTDEAGFHHWVKCEAGRLTFLPLLPTVVRDLEQDLVRLFHEMVEQGAQAEPLQLEHWWQVEQARALAAEAGLVALDAATLLANRAHVSLSAATQFLERHPLRARPEPIDSDSSWVPSLLNQLFGGAAHQHTPQSAAHFGGLDLYFSMMNADVQTQGLQIAGIGDSQQTPWPIQ